MDNFYLSDFANYDRMMLREESEADERDEAYRKEWEVLGMINKARHQRAKKQNKINKTKVVYKKPQHEF